MFIDTETLAYPLSESWIRASNPSTLFGTPFKSDRYQPVQEVPAPTVNPLIQEVRELAPVKGRGGLWRQTWQVVDLPQEEIAARTAASVENLKANVVQNTQERLNAFAATRGYDGTDSISKYQNITDAQINTLATPKLKEQVTKFRTECQYLALTTATTWATLYSIMDQVLAGTRPMPASFADIEADLPPLQWPV